MKKEEVMIDIKDASYSWGFKMKSGHTHNIFSIMTYYDFLKVKESFNVSLENVNLNLRSDDFMIVIGAVGCGKSTLLYSIMEETTMLSGT